MSEPLPIVDGDGQVIGYTDPDDPGWAEFFAESACECGMPTECPRPPSYEGDGQQGDQE